MSNPSRKRRLGARFIVLAVSAAASTALLAPAMASAKPVPVKVMTRNIYLGADLTPALGTPFPQVFTAAGDVYKQMQDTNFVARAKLLADEFAAAKPDAIGLQEVTLWRRGQRASAGQIPDGPATPATEVVYDFLQILRGEMRARGLKYRVAVVQQEGDIEVPVDVSGSSPTPEFDARLTLRDVILVKRSRRLRMRNARGENFSFNLVAPTAGLGQVEFKRGWTSVDLRKRVGERRKSFRFVNTHLEAFSAFHRRAQAAELLAPGTGVINTVDGPVRKPIVLVGDLNSDPADDSVQQYGGTPPDTRNAAAYDLFVGSEYEEGAGFVDRGVNVNTCCHNASLTNETVDFDSRIDHVLSRGRVRGVSATRTGDDPAKRTPTELWPSDHAGVVAGLRVGR